MWPQGSQRSLSSGRGGWGGLVLLAKRGIRQHRERGPHSALGGAAERVEKAPGEGWQGAGTGREAGPPRLSVREPGASLVAFEQRPEEISTGDIWGKGFWAEGELL